MNKNKIIVNGKSYNSLEKRVNGHNVCDQSKEILFYDLSENIFYLLQSCIEESANTESGTRLLSEKNKIFELTEENVTSWKNLNLDIEKLTSFEVVKEMTIT